MLTYEKTSENLKYSHASAWPGVGMGEEERKGMLAVGVSSWEEYLCKTEKEINKKDLFVLICAMYFQGEPSSMDDCNLCLATWKRCRSPWLQPDDPGTRRDSIYECVGQKALLSLMTCKAFPWAGFLDGKGKKRTDDKKLCLNSAEAASLRTCRCTWGLGCFPGFVSSLFCLVYSVWDQKRFYFWTSHLLKLDSFMNLYLCSCFFLVSPVVIYNISNYIFHLLISKRAFVQDWF